MRRALFRRRPPKLGVTRVQIVADEAREDVDVEVENILPRAGIVVLTRGRAVAVPRLLQRNCNAFRGRVHGAKVVIGDDVQARKMRVRDDDDVARIARPPPG